MVLFKRERDWTPKMARARRARRITNRRLAIRGRYSIEAQRYCFSRLHPSSQRVSQGLHRMWRRRVQQGD